ncbi:MAG TPA: BadF/BadG/BcrA/BcrD ATPase family protein [Candidatus Acidoferrales bacterium]|nr:BadF/BadG/BcrA/BcrD ATPase family protein [Candidatus Acidoferrales bacterium]
MAMVLGIDGGGTKTVAVVARDGNALGRGESGGTNLNTLQEADVAAHLREACDAALYSAGVDAGAVQSLCAGVAGVASADKGEARIRGMLESMFKAPIQVVDDVEIALEAAFRGGPGVAAICGTGSIARGRNAAGERARAGGWGSIVSDEGSGAWIGQNAVRTLLRACDMGEEPALLKQFYEAWGVADRAQFVAACNRSPLPNFAALAPLVIAVEKDGPMGELMERAGRTFADTACIVVGRLWLPYEAAKVCMFGGIFQASARMRRAFSLALMSEFSNISVQMCEAEPVEGALFLAENKLTAKAGN